MRGQDLRAIAFFHLASSCLSCFLHFDAAVFDELRCLCALFLRNRRRKST